MTADADKLRVWLFGIIEKHVQLAFYHPFVEAVASMLCDRPNNLALLFSFNIPLYFMANLHRTANAFWTF